MFFVQCVCCAFRGCKEWGGSAPPDGKSGTSNGAAQFQPPTQRLENGCGERNEIKKRNHTCTIIIIIIIIKSSNQVSLAGEWQKKGNPLSQTMKRRGGGGNTQIKNPLHRGEHTTHHLHYTYTASTVARSLFSEPNGCAQLCVFPAFHRHVHRAAHEGL